MSHSGVYLHRAVATQQSFLGGGKSIKYFLSSSSVPLNPLHCSSCLSMLSSGAPCLTPKPDTLKPVLSVQLHLRDKCNCITSTAALMCPSFCLYLSNFGFCYYHKNRDFFCLSFHHHPPPTSCSLLGLFFLLIVIL